MMTFKQFLIELFDKPWNLEQVEGGELHSTLKELLNNTHPGHRAFRLYRATDNGVDKGHIMEFHHDGKIEIHHIDQHLQSGELTGSGGGPNTKYIATMKSRIEHHVDKKGNGVKVVAKPSMINQYHSLVKRIGKTRYHVSKINKEESSHMRDLHSFNISPQRKFNIKGDD